MIFISNTSFVYIILFILVYNGIQLFSKNKQLLNWLLILGSTLILSTIVSFASLGILMLVSGGVYGIGRFLAKDKPRKRLFLNLSIGALILLFCLKNYSIANFDLLQRVGLSYILFRLIHFLMDSSKGEIKDYNVLSFINYILFFPTFIAGPIDDYNNFNYWIKQKHNNYKISMAKAGIFKLTLGIVKKFFLVPIIVNYSMDFSLFEQGFVWQEGLFLSLILYSFYILLDFSGYSDIAIGTAYLIGIKTPENFNNPYGAKSLSVFWKKWHMTFSNFLFKYVFKPLVTKLSKQFSSLPRLVVSSMGYLITFTLCGIWHGNTLNFIYWGIWHGIGLILFKLWDIYVFKKKIAPIGNNVFKTIYNGGAIVVTFIFVTIGWFFFNYQHSEIKVITQNITAENSQNLAVTPVIYEGENCFQIDYTPQTDATSIDITCESTLFDQTFEYNNISINELNRYHIATKCEGNELVKLNIRSKSENNVGAWESYVTYARFSRFKQNDLQVSLFGAYTNTVTKITTVDSLYECPLPINADYTNKGITAESMFIDRYGWAIQVNYEPYEDDFIIIDYKYEQEDWVSYTDNREGQYPFTHIHGSSVFENTSRNLAPGAYQIRMRYYTDTYMSVWFYDNVNVPDYVNN